MKHLPALAAASLFLALPLAAQTVVLREGDPSPSGQPGQTITNLGSLEVNGAGGYAYLVATDGPQGFQGEFWGNLSGGPGQVLRLPDPSGPVPREAFLSPFGISLDEIGYVSLRNLGTSNVLTDVWVDDTLVASAGGPVPGTGEFWLSLTDAGVTEQSEPYFYGFKSGTPLGAPTGKGIYFGSTATPLYEVGATYPNVSFPLSDLRTSPSWRCSISSNGAHSICRGAVIDPAFSTIFGRSLMLKDGAGLVLGGSLVQGAAPIPPSAGGLPGDTWGFAGPCEVNSAGDYFFLGGAGFPTFDEYILRNDVIWRRSGDVVDGFTLTSEVIDAAISENGRMAYAWRIDGPVSVFDHAVFLEDRLLIKRDDPVDWDGDGVLDAAFFRSAGLLDPLEVAPDGTVHLLANFLVNGVLLDAIVRFDPETVGTRYCGPAVVNSTGVAGRMGASGSADVAANDLVLEASSLPSNAFGFFVTSRVQDFVANPGGSAGNLCLGGAIGRYVGPGQIQSSGPSGSISLAVDLTLHPTPTGPTSVTAGDTWSFQLWHRDIVQGAVTSNFTDGYEIVFE
ncbi:MAG: hypothetical protein AAF726_11175 [Planctomycetota bacterium]